MGRIARLVDRVLETSVVLSFTRIGYLVRSRLFRWTPLPDMHGKVCVITGASSGLGKEMARHYARTGATVIVLARDQAKAVAVIDELAGDVGANRFIFVTCDTSSLDSVRHAAADIRRHTDRVDVLIHNAGAIYESFTPSVDGLESTIATQVTGPFLLTTLLLAPLAAASPGRVIMVSSGGMYTWKFSMDDLMMSPNDFDGVKAYAHAKRAQVMLGHEWARRAPSSDVLFASMHPGWSATPGLAKSLPTFYRFLKPFLRTPYEGIDTVLWLSHTDELRWRNGAFFFDRQVRSEYRFTTAPKQPLAQQLALWNWCVAATKR